MLQERFVPAEIVGISLSSKKWNTTFTWRKTLDAWMWAISIHWRIGAVTLLAAMAFPLGSGFFAYHLYLIWAGMTTNESSKWSYWRDDISDGLVYRASRSTLPDDLSATTSGFDDRFSPWPARSRWYVILSEDGRLPTFPNQRTGDFNSRGADQMSEADARWQKVRTISELENIYDLGFWNNLKDIFNRG